MKNENNRCNENKEKKFFPLFTDLTEKKVLVVGAGNIAERRVKTLLSFVKQIEVIAPKASLEILTLSQEGKLIYRKKEYGEADICDADMVIAATNNMKVNDAVYRACKEHGILVNTASDQQKCDFHFPGIIEQDGIVIGFNGGGKYHKKVKEMRCRIEQALKQWEDRA